MLRRQNLTKIKDEIFREERVFNCNTEEREVRYLGKRKADGTKTKENTLTIYAVKVVA